MARHKPGVVWVLRRFRESLWEGGGEQGAVRTTPDNRIQIAIRPFQSEMRYVFLSRSTARLLARRINQCLEDTK